MAIAQNSRFLTCEGIGDGPTVDVGPSRATVVVESVGGAVYHLTTYRYFSLTMAADCGRTQLGLLSGDEIDGLETMALATMD